MGIFAIIRLALEFLGLISREVHDSAQRQAGAAEQTANEGAQIAARAKEGAQISDSVTAMQDKIIDDQLKGNGP